MRTAKTRTQFDVPGTGRVTLVAGEPCPNSWEAHAPEGALSPASWAAEPATEPAAAEPVEPPADPAPVTAPRSRKK